MIENENENENENNFDHNGCNIINGKMTIV
jgi:hypothetical protein